MKHFLPSATGCREIWPEAEAAPSGFVFVACLGKRCKALSGRCKIFWHMRALRIKLEILLLVGPWCQREVMNLLNCLAGQHCVANIRHVMEQQGHLPLIALERLNPSVARAATRLHIFMLGQQELLPSLAHPESTHTHTHTHSLSLSLSLSSLRCW